MDGGTDFTPRSTLVILVISLAAGLAFAALMVEVAYEATNGLTYRQQKAVSDTFWSGVDLEDFSLRFKAEEGRWPSSFEELLPDREAFDPSIDGFGRPFRFDTGPHGPVFTSDGLDGRPGGEGMAADLVFGFDPDQEKRYSPGLIRASRGHYLKYTAPDSLLAAASVVTLLIAAMTAAGLFQQRRARPVGEPVPDTPTIELAIKTSAWFLALLATALFVGAWMLGLHHYGGRH